MAASDHLSICVTCGTQYDIPYDNRPSTCRMCLEPRQFVPPSGHSWTSLEQLKATHKNEFKQDENDGRIWSIFSTPQVAIGQRAIFIQTYTHLEWAREFQCPVYLAYEDQEWLNRDDQENRRVFFKDETQNILPDVNMVKVGGHFPGSSVLHWNKNIFTGDSIGISQSGLSRSHHSKDHQVFFFHYAFPNFVPLGPTAMHTMWKRLRVWEFTAVYSLFFTTTVRGDNVKRLMLDSMQRQARHQENFGHPLLQEQLSA
ncbi:unnamed protein product [Clonostachys chloroleuca]|uniref:Uncharacterized protein n=1 Tax=Clonostachys chloroleuca TaxID=1926264 RepID=A0AA35M7R0_9HYPO|nr:unnamed protein product [Clonostachys chloroleuca]